MLKMYTENFLTAGLSQFWQLKHSISYTKQNFQFIIWAIFASYVLSIWVFGIDGMILKTLTMLNLGNGLKYIVIGLNYAWIQYVNAKELSSYWSEHYILVWELRQCSNGVLTSTRVNRKFVLTRCKVRHWYHDFNTYSVLNVAIRNHIVIYYTYPDINLCGGRAGTGAHRTYRSNWKHQITEFGVRGA